MPESTAFEDSFTARESALLRRAEQAEARVRNLMDKVPLGYIEVDRTWKITFANELAILDARPSGDFVGKVFWQVWPELVGTDLERQYRLAMESAASVQFEFYNPVYAAWFDIAVHPDKNGICVYYENITERKQTEEALRESERRYRTFTELNPQLILMADVQGSVTYASPRMLAYSGMTMEETQGEGWRAAVHPEDELRVLDAWRKALMRDVDFEVETRIRRGSDGLYRWFWVRGLPVRNEQGKTQYWLGVCIDVHERRIAVDELRRIQRETEQQRQELETLYRTAPIGLALFDPIEFRYLRLNDRQAEIVGLPMEKILGRTLTEIAPIEGLNEMFDQVAQGTPIVNHLLEGELPMQPGIHRYWTVNYYPVYAEDGSVRAIAAASLEITAQKRAELALIQSEKLAAVGRLASSISHEINNPLESVTNLLYLSVTNAQLPPDVQSYLRTAQQELTRVSQIATQALRFHRQAIKPTLVGAADLMNSIVDLYRGRLYNSSIRVLEKYRSASRILSLENEVRQVLNNLIANSMDAMRHGGRLLLRTHDATDWKTGRKGIRLTVADTGSGMSAEVKEKLFEAFYTTKDLNGTGLGLWISRNIVTRHQGRISFKSSTRPGRTGTVFTVFLPNRLDSLSDATGSTDGSSASTDRPRPSDAAGC